MNRTRLGHYALLFTLVPSTTQGTAHAWRGRFWEATADAEGTRTAETGR